MRQYASCSFADAMLQSTSNSSIQSRHSCAVVYVNIRTTEIIISVLNVSYISGDSGINSVPWVSSTKTSQHESATGT